MIPKTIHYFWFGNNEKPKIVKKCIESWKKYLPGYEIKEWNETNYDVTKNDYLKDAYDNKKWAFVSDYARVDILNEYGGIYLDTDLEIKKSLEIFLKEKMFLGYIFDCSIGTALIGSVSNNPILKDILGYYERGDNILRNCVNNNDLFTYHFVKRVKGFKLNGKFQKTNEFTIYPKEYFERPTFNRSINYSIHHYLGSWRRNGKLGRSSIKNYIKLLIGSTLYYKIAHHRKLKTLPYYNEYIKFKV